MSTTSLPKVPVVVLTGFLGSGKTTLLNWILANQDAAGQRVAVVENEYAVEFGVENEIVEAKKGATFTEVAEVGGSCICHGGLNQFAMKLRDLIQNKRDNFDIVVVETTGLADPAFAQIFFADAFLKEAVELRAIVTVVDARHIERHLDPKPTPGSSSSSSALNEAAEQVGAADVLLLNKADLVPSEALDKLEARLKQMNPLAAVKRTEFAKVNVPELLAAQSFKLEAHPKFVQGIKHLNDTGMQPANAQHDDAVGSLVLVGAGEVEIASLKAWLVEAGKACGDDLWRIKGVVAVRDDPDKHVLQGVHQMLDVQKRTGVGWQEGASPREGGRRCQIVLIGRNLEEKRAQFEASATKRFGFPLRVMSETLLGDDPHKPPDFRLALVLMAVVLFGFADDYAEPGVLEAVWWVPNAAVTPSVYAIQNRWRILIAFVFLLGQFRGRLF